MSHRQEELEKLPWLFVFKFRRVAELRDFVTMCRWDWGYEDDEIQINLKTNSVIVTSDLIDAFAPMSERCVMHYEMVSIRLNKYQPGKIKGVSD